jgi:peptidoglycan hydrolase-like protein with peptidoglycan-binding domain
MRKLIGVAVIMFVLLGHINIVKAEVVRDYNVVEPNTLINHREYNDNYVTNYTIRSNNGNACYRNAVTGQSGYHSFYTVLGCEYNIYSRGMNVGIGSPGTNVNATLVLNKSSSTKFKNGSDVKLNKPTKLLKLPSNSFGPQVNNLPGTDVVVNNLKPQNTRYTISSNNAFVYNGENYWKVATSSFDYIPNTYQFFNESGWVKESDITYVPLVADSCSFITDLVPALYSSQPGTTVGTPVTWSVRAKGGRAPYTYYWSDVSGVVDSNHNSTTTRTYNSVGSKNIAFAIIDSDNNRTPWASCTPLNVIQKVVPGMYHVSGPGINSSLGSGSTSTFNIHWYPSIRTSEDLKIFTDYVHSDGTTAFTNITSPSPKTNTWDTIGGGVHATPVVVSVPVNTPAGTYKVMAGLFNPITGVKFKLNEHHLLENPLVNDGQNRYHIGNITVIGSTVTSSSPLSLSSCTPSVTSANTGAQVTWTARATGGTAPYRYYFSDVANVIEDNTTGTMNRTYTTAGAKSMSIAVIDGANNRTSWAFCTGNVNVTASQVGGSNGCYQYTSDLNVGSTGQAVTTLQNYLQSGGFYTGPITGYFGDITRSAVQAYQTANGIPSTGFVNSITRAKLNSICGAGTVPPPPVVPPTATGPIINTWTGPSSVTAGTNLSYSINFYGARTTTDQTIFVHFVDSTGATKFVSSVAPSQRTTQWSGTVSTPITVAVPANTPAGTYKVMAGLYNTSTSARLPLTTGSGVTAGSGTRYEVGTVSVVAVPTNRPPVGYLDGLINTSILSGWALDPNDQTRPIDVHIYVDGAYNAGGTYIGSVNANMPRPDLTNGGYTSTNHGYNFQIPTRYQDGRAHSYYAYGIDLTSNSNNPLLTNSPKTYTIGSATPSPTTPPPVVPPTATGPIINTWTGPSSVTAGTNLSYSISFDAVRTTTDQTIFVHFVDSTGATKFVSSVAPSQRTTQWSGTVSTPITVAVPANTPAGTYKVMAGLYHASSNARLPLTAGSGVTASSGTRYQVGTVNIVRASGNTGSIWDAFSRFLGL